jgi:hypothetical protein
MKATIRFFLLVVFLAALALNMTAAQSEQSLEGAWNVSVHFADPGFPPCAPAGALITAATGNQGSIIAESCFASEGAGYGSWIRTAPNRFSATFVGNSFGPSGLVESTYKVRAWVSPGPSNDMFSGPFRTEFFDLSGNAIGSPVEGTVSAVRIQAEP